MSDNDLYAKIAAAGTAIAVLSKRVDTLVKCCSSLIMETEELKQQRQQMCELMRELLRLHVDDDKVAHEFIFRLERIIDGFDITKQ